MEGGRGGGPGGGEDEEISSVQFQFHCRGPKHIPWLRTFLTQAALCLFLFAALRIGRPQIQIQIHSQAQPPLPLVSGSSHSPHFYFISVAGGSRPAHSQSRLLKQMVMAANIYNPNFVLNIAQMGQQDPLSSNATLHPQLLKMPWYTTTASRGRGIGNFMKKVELPYEQVLEIIGVDTGPFQNFLQDENSTNFKEQVDWLKQTLAISKSDWRIVVGFNPLVLCNQHNNTQAIKLRGLLQDIFLRYRVNAYLSTNGCRNYFYNDRGTSYIGNHIPAEKLHNSFLLHRVSSLEIKTYLVDSEGRAELKYSFPQHGREVM